MKILSVSSDRKVFEEGSTVRERLLEYAKLVDELHVIVFTKNSSNFRSVHIESNVHLYSSNAGGKFSYIFSAIACARKLKGHGVAIDVVTTQDPFEAGLAGYFIARIFGARLHIQIHTDIMSPYFKRESMLNRIRVGIAKFLIPRAHAIRVVSERIRKSIEQRVHPGVSIAVLPIFIEMAKGEGGVFKKKYPQFSKTILVASRLSREKNIGMIIEAMRTITKKFPTAGLVVVGDGPELEHLKALVKKYDLDAKVMFEGWRSDLTSYYRTSDVFALSSFYEGYGMTVVEAEASGCPVIMTEVGCAGDIIKDGQNGLVVPVGDTQALVAALDLFLSGNSKIAVNLPVLPSKEEYLQGYKKSWENALA